MLIGKLTGKPPLLPQSQLPPLFKGFKIYEKFEYYDNENEHESKAEISHHSSKATFLWYCDYRHWVLKYLVSQFDTPAKISPLCVESICLSVLI